MLLAFLKYLKFYIGDNFKDIIAAKGAGIHSVAALWGLNSADRNNKILAQKTDIILKSPIEILHYYQVTTPHFHAVPRWDNQAGARFRTAVLKSGGLR